MDPNTPQYTGEKESHRRRWIIIILLILLIAGGVAAYFITKDDENNNETSTSQTTTPPTTTSQKTFSPAVNSNQPYAATVTTNANGQKKTATLISDGQGNFSYSTEVSGQTVSTVYTKDAYYICQGTSKCIKYATTNLSKSGFDPSSYQYDTSRIENLKNSANYKGQQACPNGGGTCEVWSVTSANGNTTSTVYINTSTKRIVKATTSNGTTENDITYDYKNVHITVPTNYTTVPSQ